MPDWEKMEWQELRGWAQSRPLDSGPAIFEAVRRATRAIEEFNRQSGEQTRRMVRLTRAILWLTGVLAFLAVAQIWVAVRLGAQPVSAPVSAPARTVVATRYAPTAAPPPTATREKGPTPGVKVQ
jgi:hypothetical protein